MNRLHISPQTREHILASLRAAYPDEGCGALIGIEHGDGLIEVVSAEALPNAETVRGEDRFSIEPHAYAALEQRLSARNDGTRIVGFFHSHPDGVARPSSIDLEAAIGLYEVVRTFYVYAIAAIGRGEAELTCWKLNAAADEFVQLPTDP